MLISALLLLPIAAGGLALTYLIEKDEPFLWRLAAGTVIGSALYGTLAFVIGCFTGLGIAAPIAMIATLAPIAVFRDKETLKHFRIDWQRATNKMQGGSTAKFIRFAFYAFFFLLFCFFFVQAMYQTPAGIYTGGSQNLGDLAFHLGAIFSFTDGNNLPPINPSFAGAKFSYPFIADVVTAGFVKLGADVQTAIIVQDVAWAFSLLVVLERFVFRLTNDRLVGKLAPWLLFLSGGLGFIWFVGDYWAQGKDLFEFLKALPKDYTISDDFRWGNSLVVLFITQRSLLLGMPLTIVILQKLWEWFQREKVEKGEMGKGEKGEKRKSERVAETQNAHFFTFSLFHLSPFAVGLLAGMLPLVHLHSLIVLFIVTTFLFWIDFENWRTWVAFGVGVCMIAVPELVWSVVGTASNASEFVAWHFGWDAGETNILWFWLKNAGLVVPLIALGLYLYFKRPKDSDGGNNKLLLFYAPFLFMFIACNIAKFAPWEWDNIKILIYWYVGSLSFIGLALAWAWRQSRYLKAVAALAFIALTFSGALDVWRTVSGQIKYQVFDADSVHIADQIRAQTPPKAMFLNRATYNTAIALTGRQSLMRYPGHLSSYGIDYAQRESDVKKMYAGGPAADALLASYGIDYVIISQVETGGVQVNKDYLSKFPVIAESGSAKVYKVR
jgi:hypothetical protein